MRTRRAKRKENGLSRRNLMTGKERECLGVTWRAWMNGAQAMNPQSV
jgi:hypothetical protein